MVCFAVCSSLFASAAGAAAKKAGKAEPLPVVIGGFDPARPSDLPALLKQLDDALPKMKAVGATSHEGYVRWNLIEPKPGKFDFSVYDPIVSLYKKHGMKWVPFLIIGSPYSMPDWYYHSDKKQGYVCLEHGQESDVQSLWNPVMRNHVEQVVREFAKHYRDTGVVESVLIGVTGNYGEAIYPASGNDWTSDIYGQYHTHPGFWAGDPFAKASFRKWLKARYGDINRLNVSWRSSFADFDSISPVPREAAPSDRAWYDFIRWYRESMNDYTDFWVRTVRNNFPKTPVYICTGGDANPKHGSDFSAQSRIAAKHGAGVRITNEGSDYALNFSITRWVASASHFYGGYFGFEPAGFVDASGVTARVFNVLASGAAQLHSYWGNIFDTPDREAAFVRDLPKFRRTSPLTDIALYYSKPSVAFGAEFFEPAREMRDYFDYEIADDSMIREDALKEIRVLFWLSGNRIENDTAPALLKWVRSGGTLVYNAASGPIMNEDGATPDGWPPELAPLAVPATTASVAALRTNLSPAKIISRNIFSLGAGKVLAVPRADSDVFKKITTSAKVIRMLFEDKLGFNHGSIEIFDPDRDKIFFSLIDSGRTLAVLSQAKEPVTKTVTISGRSITVDTKPNEIIELKLEK